MSTRFAAARPKRAGEEFARTHHNDSPSSKKPRFDVRNPSALAPDAPEEDAVLEADVIGGGAGIKRNAVNLDGYDSDSDNEGFDARAEERGRNKNGKVDLFEQLDKYDNPDGAHDGRNAETADEDDMDIFQDRDDSVVDEDEDDQRTSKKNKKVTFLEEGQIKGQDLSSKSGGHISANFTLDPKGSLSSHAMDDRESSDDEEDAVLAAEEEGLDEEVGAGGLKRNAPKVDAFHMKAEQEEGRFDAAGNFVRKAVDPDAVHDNWLEGVSKKDMKRAAEAHEKREAEQRQKRINDDAVLTSDILRTLILRLEKAESVLEALARFGREQAKTKKVPKWKLKKQISVGGKDVDEEKSAEDQKQVKIKEAVDAITEAADHLLTRGQTDIYEQEREMLIRQYRRETGEDWVEPPEPDKEEDTGDPPKLTKLWDFRWTDGRDGAAKQGPYDSSTMVAWQDAGYFGEGVEFRQVGDKGRWSRVVDFV